MEYETQEIAIDLIDEPPQAMRTDIPRDAVFELAADIKRNGLISPITVRPVADRFQVVAGHRRLLAHRYGGMPSMRCVIRDLTDEQAFAVMVSENLKRENVNPVDEAVTAARALGHCGGDLDAAAKMCGESRYWVETRLAIADMQEDVKQLLREKKLPLGVALELRHIVDDIDRAAILQMAVSQGVSVVMAKYYVAQWQAGLFGHATSVALPDPDAPGFERHIVMLRCAVDGKEHPASEMRSVLVHSNNVGYVEAIREHLNTPPVVA